jgi:hypothetical protein
MENLNQYVRQLWILELNLKISHHFLEFHIIAVTFALPKIRVNNAYYSTISS